MVDQLAAAKRTQAQARASRGTRVMVAAREPIQGRYIVYNLDLAQLFDPHQPQSRLLQHGDAHGLLPLANPVATIDGLDDRIMQVAATASGHVVAAAATCGRTVIADAATGSVSLVPGLRHVKLGFSLVPVGDHAFLLIRYRCRYSFDESDHICELLFSDPSGGWAFCSLPDPPGLRPRSEVTGFFVAGAHVWVSLGSQGTFSFDTVRRQWRTQGPWELPLTDQLLFLPDFLGTGRNLLFGFVEGSLKLGACDMDATPPVIIASWPETRPDRRYDAPYLFKSETPDLTYFGDGRFCISLNASIKREADGQPPPPICRFFVSFLASRSPRR